MAATTASLCPRVADTTRQQFNYTTKSRQRREIMKLLKDIPYKGLFGAAPVAPLSEHERMAFVTCAMTEGQRGDAPLSGPLLEALTDLRLELGAKRLEWAGIDINHVASPEVRIAVSVAPGAGRPGICVMWAYTLLWLRVHLGHPLRMEDLAASFPIGFPTLEACETAWDQQKDGGLNQLDRLEWWHDLKALM